MTREQLFKLNFNSTLLNKKVYLFTDTISTFVCINYTNGWLSGIFPSHVLRQSLIHGRNRGARARHDEHKFSLNRYVSYQIVHPTLSSLLFKIFTFGWIFLIKKLFRYFLDQIILTLLVNFHYKLQSRYILKLRISKTYHKKFYLQIIPFTNESLIQVLGNFDI